MDTNENKSNKNVYIMSYKNVRTSKRARSPALLSSFPAFCVLTTNIENVLDFFRPLLYIPAKPVFQNRVGFIYFSNY